MGMGEWPKWEGNVAVRRLGKSPISDVSKAVSTRSNASCELPEACTEGWSDVLANVLASDALAAQRAGGLISSDSVLS